MVQLKDQTYEEELEMYMACSKKELAEMLIEANKHLLNLLVDTSPPTKEDIEWANSVIKEHEARKSND